MKKAILTSSLIIASLTSTSATYAASTQVKQGTIFTTSTIAGAILGGPVGFFLGAIGGAYMGEQIDKADKVDLMQEKLEEAEFRVTELHTQLAQVVDQTTDLPQNVDLTGAKDKSLSLQALKLQVLFHTGEDQISRRSKEKMNALSLFLQEHPNLNVRLDGHADPRGTDEYNNVLSDQRALAVQRALEIHGIDSSRIERRAFGASRSMTTMGDTEGYALDRRVDIKVYSPTGTKSLAQLN